MRLNTKIILIMALSGVFLITILCTVAGIIFYKGFANIENANAQKEVERILQILRNEEQYLDTTAGDYAGWDDTYAFVQDGNQSYIKANLIDSTFSQQKLNLFILLNSSGRMVLGTGFDLKQNKKIPIYKALKRHLSSDSPLTRHLNTQSIVSGLLLLPEGPMMISSRPILTSEYKGPIQGTLIMGRLIDDRVIRKLMDLSKSSIIMKPLDENKLDNIRLPFKNLPEAPAAIQLKVLNRDVIAGETMICDIYGKPILLLKVNIKREMLGQTKLTLYYLFISLIIITIMFTVIVLALFKKTLLTRLNNLSQAVRDIDVDHCTPLSVIISGNDELTNLTENICTLVNKVKEHQNKIIESVDMLTSTNKILEHEIDEHRRIEQALQESESKFRDLSEKAIVGIYLLEDNLLRYVNAEFADIIEYRVDEITDKLGPKDVIFPEDFPLVQENLRKRISGDGASLRYEFRVRTKKGEIKHVEVYSSRTMYRGKPAIIGTLLNITERIRMEEERQKTQERLSRAEKMESLGQLAGGVAHDLNNVLGILSGYSELLLMEIPEGQRSRGHVEKILQSTEKGAAIIEDLLTLARRGVTVSDVINLNSVVSGFLKTPVFEKVKDYHPGVIFRIECQKELLNVKGSPVHLEKTLMNLVSNAAEAISGGGEVTIRTENRYLDTPVTGYDEIKEGDYAVLTVSDTGMGITAEDRKRIFEPFYTKKTMGKSGTGLGLAIVWGTVKDHNGYIDVQTTVSKGTTITLYFPVTREKMTVPQQKELIERYMGKGETVLVVDDIAEQRDVASGLLTRLGCEVHVVSSGEAAVEYLKVNKAAILVLDMIMAPGIDGLETYERVLEVSPNQKAIIVSGFSETDRVKKAQKLGAGAYIKKPYVMEKIGVAIRDELYR